MTPDFELLWDVLEEHLDEAEYLWGVWEQSLVAPNYALGDVAEHAESRLFAHIEGLVAGGAPAASRLLVPALESDDFDRVCAAAAALLLAPGESGVRAVLAAVHELPTQRPALVRALACSDRADVRARVRDLLTDMDESVVAAAAEVLLFHHESLGDAVPVLLASDDPHARALGLQALPNDPAAPKKARAVQAALADENPVIVDAAIGAGIFLVPAPAWARARSRAEESGGSRAMLLLALHGAPEDRAPLLSALQDPLRRPAALVAFGYIGAPELVDTCLEWLDEPTTGFLIGEMMSAITGIDLAAAGLALPVEDDALDHIPEDDLPRPDPMRTLQWWLRQRAHLQEGERYIAGRPRSLAGILDALARGPMRRRCALLLDLQLHAPAGSRLRLQPHAPTWRQRAELAELYRLLGFTSSRSVS